MHKKQLTDVYKYMHIYSPKRQLGQTLQFSNYAYHFHVKPDLHFLSTTMNEIHWEDRLSPFNHGEYFPAFVTGMVDTFPVYVSQPEDGLLARSLYNPKYGGCIYKFQLGCDFLGRNNLLTGPHMGVMNDGNTWVSTGDKHPMFPWELYLGDGAYPACPQIITPYRCPPHGSLTYEQEFMNEVISHYRARVEHKNKLMVRHNILGTVFRGGRELLADAGQVLAQTENVDSKLFLRYPPVGPFPHFPNM